MTRQPSSGAQTRRSGGGMKGRAAAAISTHSHARCEARARCDSRAFDGHVCRSIEDAHDLSREASTLIPEGEGLRGGEEGEGVRSTPRGVRGKNFEKSKRCSGQPRWALTFVRDGVGRAIRRAQPALSCWVRVSSAVRTRTVQFISRLRVARVCEM